jgi:signal transduction histidine kinase
MRDFWRRVGGPDSINWLSFALTYPVILVTTLIGSGASDKNGAWPIVLASSIGAAAMFAFLLVSKYTILFGSKHKPIPLFTIFVILVSLLIRAFVFDFMLQEFGLESAPKVAYRFFASLSSMGITLLLMAYIMSLAREFSRNTQRLRETNEALRATKRDIDKKIRTKREEVVGSVRAELDGRLRALTGTSAKQALAKFRETIEDVVRPVSYELAKQVTDLSPIEAEPASDRVLWRKVFTDSTSVNPFRPFAFSFWAGFATLCFAPLQWGFAIGVTLAFVVSLVPFAALSAFSFAWKRFIRPSSVTQRSLAFTYMLIATGLIGGVAISRVSGIESVADRSFAPLVALWVILGWGIALVPSLQTETARVLTSLNRSTNQLREELVRLNTAYRLQQQAIARALHGPIQDALSVAAFKLSAAIKNKTATDELVAELNSMISKTIVLLDIQQDELPALEQSLQDLAEFWDGVAKIRYKLSPTVKKNLAAHPVTASTAIELIREACSNAVRHGRATQIRVDVSLSRDNKQLKLTVANNGELVTMKTQPGLGTKLLNELSLSWSLNSTNDQTVLEATTPII